MALQNRRGNFADFNPNKMLPGEFAYCLNTKDLYYCYSVGNVKKLLTEDEVTDILNASATAYEAFQQLVADLDSNPNELNNILNNIAALQSADIVAQNFINGKMSNCILEMPTKPTFNGLNITVYAGTKVLIPNGLNADGTLKSVEYAYSADRTSTAVLGERSLIVSNSGAHAFIITANLAEVDDISDLPTAVTNTLQHLYYVRKLNRNYQTSGSITANWTTYNGVKIGSYVAGASTIASLTINDVFRFADYGELNRTISEALTSSSLGTIYTHEIRKKSGICQYKLDGLSGTWLANTKYTVATLPIGYRPSTAIGKTINLRVGVLGYFGISTLGVIEIIPRADTSAQAIAILETFLSA